MSDSRRLVGLSATAAFVIIGCTWAFATARYGGPDEPAHVIRAAAVAQGDLLGRPAGNFEPGYRSVNVPASLASGDPSCFRHDETITADCAAVTVRAGTAQVATSAGTAPPWYYAIVGLIARLLSSGLTVLGYRMATVLICAVILGHAVGRSGRYGGGPWLIAALTPAAWFLMGVVGTSGIEIALVVLALVEAVGRFHQLEPASIARVTVPLAICLLLRPAAIIDVAVVALVVVPTLKRPFTVRSLIPVGGPLAAVAVATVVWNRWTGAVINDQRTADTRSLASTLRASIGHIPLNAHRAIGALGWNEFYAPGAAQLIWIATLAFAAYWVFVHVPGRWWHLAWLAAALALPTIFEVIVHRRIGSIWQGRYSIAFATGGVLYAGRGQRPGRAVTRTLVAAAAVAEVTTLWQVLRRYMVGLDGSLLLRSASWQPPLSAWLLLAVNAVAIAWLASLAVASDDVAEDVDDVVGRSGVVVDR